MLSLQIILWEIKWGGKAKYCWNNIEQDKAIYKFTSLTCRYSQQISLESLPKRDRSERKFLKIEIIKLR